jgi:hypothetical protein
MDALRISPRYTSNDWYALDQNSPGDWDKAANIVRDRLEGRFLRFASDCLKAKHSGFVVLAIDCLLAEAIQQFKEGIINGNRKSGPIIKRFLESSRFQPDFDADARKRFYEDIRCGLLHQAEAKGMWLIRRNQPSMLQRVAGGDGYIIDVKRFHSAVCDSLDDYLKLIPDPSDSTFRTNLWAKMDNICDVRKARGVLYESATDS